MQRMRIVWFKKKRIKNSGEKVLSFSKDCNMEILYL